MTTDDVQKTVESYYTKCKRWPSYAELAEALVANGFTVDEADLDELLKMLFKSNGLHLNNGMIEL